MSDNHSEKELWEKFTFEGFLAVSYYAAIFAPLFAFPIIYIFDINFSENIFTLYKYTYPISWILCFLIFCLIPKLQAQKEEKNKNPQKRYKK